MKKKILIVEDDLNAIDIYSTALMENGFEVVVAKDGQEGLKKAAEEKPNLILLDILMPVMDGFTMLQKLRQEGDYGKKVPVVMLTNLSATSEDIIKKVAETEPVQYIVKASFPIDQVVKKVREALK